MSARGHDGTHATLRAVEEALPGPKWKGLFDRFWPSYQAWFLKEGDGARPTYAASVKMLRRHMPELLPTYERLVALAAGGDPSSRFLSLYRPTPYLTGCSQAAWTGGEPLLIRNYDYSPSLWEAVLLKTAWNGRRVIAMSDCLWGVLDGINEDGLAVSLSFGGRPVVGDGFGCPLVLRYVLEFCRTAKEAAGVLERVPSHMAYNVAVLDQDGDFLTAYLAPDRPTVVRRWPLSTNHQETVSWKEHAEATASLEREQFLADRLGDPLETGERLASRFLDPPLYTTAWRKAHGTLYTAIYRPWSREAEFRWPGRALRQSVDRFREAEFPLVFPA